MRKGIEIDECKRVSALGAAKKHVQECLEGNRPDKLDDLYAIMDGVVEYWKMRDHIEWLKVLWPRLRRENGQHVI